MIDKAELDEAERIFRTHDANREELKTILKNQTFVGAVELLKAKMRFEASFMETFMAGDSLISVRMNSQRIGAEGLLDDLWGLTKPYLEQEPDLEAKYGTDEL